MADATPAQKTQADIIAEESEDQHFGHPLDPTRQARMGRPLPEKLDTGPKIDPETGGYGPAAYEKTRRMTDSTGKMKNFPVTRQDF